MGKKSSKILLNERIGYQLGIIKRQGIRTYAKGFVRKAYYIYLRRRYRFDPWHLSVYEHHPYATDIVREINNMPGSQSFTICEIGCGLGDIIRHINAEHKYGYDISQSVINCAKHLGGGAHFSVGSFEEAAKETPANIDVLIVVNWLHGLTSEEVKKLFDVLLGAVEVKRIVMDVMESPLPNKFQHNVDELFPEYKSRLLMASRVLVKNEMRYVYVLEKE
ncbi:MAG: class I SAM-dependent methyltransferase [Lachnospiraceae bacterium]|nr:class I SAM-dependent methyltransferase [Lachnospiraceae bacterium]